MSVSETYMRRKLLNWNPHWNPQTVEGWNVKQLTAVYSKESQKIVKQIRTSLGLS